MLFFDEYLNSGRKHYKHGFITCAGNLRIAEISFQYEVARAAVPMYGKRTHDESNGLEAKRVSSEKASKV